MFLKNKKKDVVNLIRGNIFFIFLKKKVKL